MLRQGDINRDEYTQLNILTDSLGEEEIDIEDEDEFTKMIESTLDYIIQHNKKELMD